jgi:uncharacterized glyoxalase superfamily protein PhnB
VCEAVKANRSVPSATVVPVLIYPDVRAAVEWLHEAFGFAERVRIGEAHRAQLRVGDSGAVIVADVRHDQRAPRSGEVTHLVMVRVEDAAAHCAHARLHGARIVMEPTDFEYGERQYVAEDLAGHRWTFSETLTDVAPEAWGGTTIQ